MNKNQIYRITENVIRRLVKEGLLTDENEEDVSGELEQELIDFCYNNDFLYIINGRLRAANSSEIKSEIINDIKKSPFLKITHEYDYLLSSREDEFEGMDVKVFKLKDDYGYEYGIVYER